MLPVRYTPQAEKYFKKIKDLNLKQEYAQAIDRIRQNPNLGSLKSHDLAGIRGYDIYYGKTNYEIAYTIIDIDGDMVLILLAGTRENFYRELKKYIKKFKLE